MFTNNNFSQTSWFTAENSNPMIFPGFDSDSSSVGSFSAAPVSFNMLTSQYLTFQPTSLNSSVLQCSILGLDSQKHFEIFTSFSPRDTSTMIRRANGQALAIIEWTQPPTIELVGVSRPKKISQWLKLSSDKSHRILEVFGRKYAWVPSGNAICLYNLGAVTDEYLAKIVRGRSSAVILEISNEAVQSGLLDSVVVSTMLLQCGRNID